MRWMPYTAGFNFVDHKPRLLQAWVSGRGARLMDDLTDDEVFDQTVQILNNMLLKHYNVTRPVAMIRYQSFSFYLFLSLSDDIHFVYRSKWHQNKHFRGTYSYQSIDSIRMNSTAKELSEPIMKMGKPVSFI